MSLALINIYIVSDQLVWSYGRDFRFLGYYCNRGPNIWDSSVALDLRWLWCFHRRFPLRILAYHRLILRQIYLITAFSLSRISHRFRPNRLIASIYGHMPFSLAFFSFERALILNKSTLSTILGLLLLTFSLFLHLVNIVLIPENIPLIESALHFSNNLKNAPLRLLEHFL